MNLISKIILRTTIFSFCLFLFTECKKKEEEKNPSADFTTDKSSYVAGETVTLTNTSTNGSTYRWTMPDGQTSKTENAVYTINETMADGSLSFKLEAFSKSGEKSDYSVKIIPVKAASGELVVHPVDKNFYTYYTLSIDGGPGVKKYFPNDVTDPSCGQASYPYYTLSVGLHVVTITYPDATGTAPLTLTVQVKSNQCTKLGFPKM